ncbi:MAG: hypothetical protein WBQ36_15030 [Desulfobaccales bacterium]
MSVPIEGDPLHYQLGPGIPGIILKQGKITSRSQNPVNLDDYPGPFLGNDVVEHTVGIAKVNSFDLTEVSMITKRNSSRPVSLTGMRQGLIRGIETDNFSRWVQFR